MTARCRIAILLTLLSAFLAPREANAERLIVSVSNHRVTVTPAYSGEELVLFGSVEKDASTPANRSNYDLVVTVIGPRADMVTRRKERKFGIWINTDYREFLQVPTYLALFANRPFDTIASPEVQRRQQHAAVRPVELVSCIAQFKTGELWRGWPCHAQNQVPIIETVVAPHRVISCYPGVFV